MSWIRSKIVVDDFLATQRVRKGSLPVREFSAALIDATDLEAACSGFKKKTHKPTRPNKSALGGRTLKTGQSRWFVGYKKHTLRLWWRAHTASVLLVPLVSWVAPINVSEGGLFQSALLRAALVVVAQDHRR